eukprot:g12584.t1
MQEYFRRIAVEEDRPYYEFLYDWRRPAVEIADQLESFIDGVARENAHRDGGANKPQVIGHSFGALLLVVSSVLLIAPPMRLTPYFLMDILYGDPDYVIDGATHFSFPSVYTFFPDNRYNAEGRWGESECGSLFNFHDTETWTRILKVPHRMSEAKAEAHLRNSLTAAHLFWDRIADGTERLVETEKKGTSGSRTGGGHQDDHFAPTRVLPPVSLIVGTGHATGEKLVLLRAATEPEPEDADPGERFWLCGSPECVPGDGRLPGNRILPRGFENQLLQVYETAANHSQMVNDLDTLGRALSELDEHALLQRQSGSERNTDRTKQHDVYASAHA